MKLSEIKASPQITIKEIFDELSKIFDDNDLSQDDVVKLKDLDLKDDVIELHVETHALETDHFTKISMGNGMLKITGFEQPMALKVKDSAEDMAQNVLGAISSAAEREDDEHRDDEEGDDFGR